MTDATAGRGSAENWQLWRQRIRHGMTFLIVGGFLCLIDLKYTRLNRSGTSVSGWRFDFLNDTLGVALILYGLKEFWSAPFGEKFNWLIRGACLIACVSLLLTFVEYRVFKVPDWWVAIRNIWGMVRLAGVVMFCHAMVLMAEVMGLNRSLRSWKFTERMFWFLYVLPLGAAYVVSFGAVLKLWKGLQSESTLLTVSVLGLLALPLLSMIRSTWITSDETKPLPGQLLSDEQFVNSR